MSLTLTDKNKATIKQVFNMYANQDGKITKEGLEQIFEMIGYKVSPDQMNEIKKMLFENKSEINFQKFLELFKLQLNELTKDDIKSAFKVLAKDSDNLIPIAVIKQIIDENSGLSETDTLFLLNQIMHYKDDQDNVNFVALLKNFDIN